MIDTEAEHDTSTEDKPHRKRSRGRFGSRWAQTAPAIIVLGILFTGLYSQARTVAITSDGAANALQAWDMLHGNILLHNWILSDVSFYTTELPEYMVVESLFGLGPNTVAIASALTYTLIVALGVFAAVGRSSGRERWIRGGIAAAAIMAPSMGPITNLLMGAPDHIGTAVPLLIAYIVLDRFGGRRWTPWLLALILAWGAVGDSLIEIAGALPIVVVAAVRALKDPVGRRVEAWIAVGAAVAVPISMEVIKALHALGAFTVYPPPLTLIDLNDLPTHFSMTVKSVLDAWSADFSDLTPATEGHQVVIAGYHLAFVIVAVLAARYRLRRFAIADSRLDQVLAVALCTVLLAYMLTSVSNGTDVYTSREITVVMPIGAVLLARVVAAPADAWLASHFARRVARRLVAVTVAGLVAASSLILAVHSTEPAKASDSVAAVDWLTEHGLTSGIGGYWQGSVVTALSHGRVASRPIATDGTYIQKRYWESKTDWYSPEDSSANFMIVDTTPGNSFYGTVTEAVHTFGEPVESAVFPTFTILVWDHNILGQLH